MLTDWVVSHGPGGSVPHAFSRLPLALLLCVHDCLEGPEELALFWSVPIALISSSELGPVPELSLVTYESGSECSVLPVLPSYFTSLHSE